MNNTDSFIAKRIGYNILKNIESGILNKRKYTAVNSVKLREDHVKLLG